MRGSCLCRRVVYEVAALSGRLAHCHCRTCRKAHAAAFTTTARATRQDFRWLQGADGLRSFESTPGKLRHFCGACGSQLMAEWLGDPEVIVRVATLDEDPGLRPSARIWTSHDVPWLAADPLLPTFAEAPPVPRPAPPPTGEPAA